MTTVYIYGLVCPIEDKIMYVGQTTNVKRRLEQHLTGAKKGDRSPKGEWLRQLQRINLVPLVKTIDTCSEDEWRSRERYWVDYYRSINPNLKNSDWYKDTESGQIYMAELGGTEAIDTQNTAWRQRQKAKQAAIAATKGGKTANDLEHAIVKLRLLAENGAATLTPDQAKAVLDKLLIQEEPIALPVEFSIRPDRKGARVGQRTKSPPASEPPPPIPMATSTRQGQRDALREPSGRGGITPEEEERRAAFLAQAAGRSQRNAGK